jgi:glycine dehydrogenase subunit 1
MALAATIYLSLLGKSGLKQVANLCYQKAHYAADVLNQIPFFSVISDAPFFHEFILKCPRSVESVNAHLLENDIIGGLDLGKDCEALANHMLICVTEMTSKDDIDYLASVLQEVSRD